MISTLGVLGFAFVIGVPIAFALALSGLIYMTGAGEYPSSFSSYLFGVLNSSALLSIPFFILAAEILSRSGGIKRLIRMVDACVGHNRGGLPVVAVFATAFFSAICGSSAATAAAIGRIMIPEMIARGYDKRFTVGLIASAGGLGILIPPSIPLIVYGIVTDTSIGALFRAAIVPGLLLAAVLAVVAYVLGRRSGVAPSPPQPWSVRLRKIWQASGILFMPVLILGGIQFGFFTPTEASAVSCIYALLLAIFVYRAPLSSIPSMLTLSAATGGMILLILAAANLFSYMLTAERIPHGVFNYIVQANLETWQLLGSLMLFFLICGMFLEIISIILITMPILATVLVSSDVNLIHFAILLVLNMELAVITPPIGLNLFIVSAVSRVPVYDVFRGTLPFALAILLVLIAMIFVPGTSFLTVDF